MLDYKEILLQDQIISIEQLRQMFWDKIAWEWTTVYENTFPKHGEVTLQNFYEFSFVIDHVWDHITDPEYPETRVVGFFGISHVNINESNRKMMRKFWGKASESFKHFGNAYDKGHFIAHGFGGPIDVNLFPHRRDINRGWSPEGKRYRAMERFVAANPGTFVFSRPIYNDLSVCPFELEYGYCDKDMNLVVEVFPNR